MVAKEPPSSHRALSRMEDEGGRVTIADSLSSSTHYYQRAVEADRLPRQGQRC